ncbi:MAG: NnrU family protein [Burkholderiales bacterium]
MPRYPARPWHFVTSTPLRGKIVGKLREGRYLGLYSLVAALAIVWMVIAYGNAPLEPLWGATRWLPIVTMPVALVLLTTGYFRNPAAVMQGGLLKNPDPARGIIRVTRHPVMWAIMLWAGAHLLARGDVKSVVFFGSFFVIAGGGTILQDLRKAKTLGEDWTRFAAVSSNVPFLAILQGRNTLKPGEIGWAKPLAGIALYAVLLYAHDWLFGTRPY